ncbi:MAG: phage holin family protein [Oscillospiraceae bacterium]
MNTEIVSVAAISVISFLIAQGIKATPLDNKWLPVICGICGAILGYLGFLLMPNFPAGDPISAIAVGIVSGLAATGTHQAIKQLKGGTKSE